MPQNWNNVLQFVKTNLGAKTSSLEFTDDEFIHYFQNESLSYFSQIIPHNTWCVINSSNKYYEKNMYSENVYKLPENDFEIIDINEIHTTTINTFRLNTFFFSDPLDSVIRSIRYDIREHILPVNDFHFIKPDLIRFSQELMDQWVVIELNVEHANLHTIPSDMYHKLFKPMCLKNACEMLLNSRNKFTDLTTPFGNIELNINQLESKINDLDQKINDIIDNLPHRKYIEFI